MSDPTSRPWLPSVGNLIVLAGVLMSIALGVTFGLPHWRKLQLLHNVERSGGLVRSEYVGPERFRERFGGDDAGFLTRLTDIRADDVDDRFLSLAADQPELRFLSVSGRDISGDGLRALSGAKNAREIHLIDAGLGDEDIAHLGGIENLQALVLPHNAVEGPGFRNFPEQSPLRQLDLTWCPVTDEGLRFIARLLKLQSLDLSGTAITDRGLIHLELHPELTTLNLYGTSVGDEAIWSLARMPRLKEVVLTDTHVSETGRQRLMELRPEIAVVAR